MFFRINIIEYSILSQEELLREWRRYWGENR